MALVLHCRDTRGRRFGIEVPPLAGGPEVAVELVHDEHDTLTIAPGAYKVIRQREYHPEEIRNVAD